MDLNTCLSKMVPPGAHKVGKYLEGIVQVWVTHKCENACVHCLQCSNVKTPTADITVDQYAQAVYSLKDYFGVVGMFGGNPTLHPQFEELCEVLKGAIPYYRRGLWSSSLNGHGKLVRETFNPAVSNINVHTNSKAFYEFQEEWPEVRVFGLEDSTHAPAFISLRETIEDKEDCYALISKCEINRHWSPMVAPFRGELRAYFCEVAGAQAMLHQGDPDYPDLGVVVDGSWWKRPMSVFAKQVEQYCLNCSVPLNVKGSPSQGDTPEHVSKYHLPFMKLKGYRDVHEVTSLSELDLRKDVRIIDYIGNTKKLGSHS